MGPLASLAVCDNAPNLAHDASTALIGAIQRSIRSRDWRSLTFALKAELKALGQTGMLDRVPFPAPCQEGYTRRLVHSDPNARFTVISMTWSRGQVTPLHDHDGVWCVEAVTRGEMEIRNYSLEETLPSGLCRFEPRETVAARAGSSGGLIPPFEHHVFGNVGATVAHTIHVYGGPMQYCDIFLPVSGALYRRQRKELRFA